MNISTSRPSFRPLLPVGFHQTDLSRLRRLCVEYFPASVSRPKLIKSIELIVALTNRASIPARLWIDGGFLTEEPNPSECDITIVLVASVYYSLSADQREFFDWFREASLIERYSCNNYGFVIDAERPDWEILYRYWLRQYGFEREQGKKGVVEILVPSLEQHDPAR